MTAPLTAAPPIPLIWSTALRLSPSQPSVSPVSMRHRQLSAELTSRPITRRSTPIRPGRGIQLLFHKNVDTEHIAAHRVIRLAVKLTAATAAEADSQQEAG